MTLFTRNKRDEYIEDLENSEDTEFLKGKIESLKRQLADCTKVKNRCKSKSAVLAYKLNQFTKTEIPTGNNNEECNNQEELPNS